MKTVPLYGRVAAGRVTLVDDEDYDLVMQYRWHVYEIIQPGRHPCGPYACTKVRAADGRQKNIRLHNVILGVLVVDHVNQDTLDNRRQNLRPATVRQNAHNRRGNLAATSQYKGVHWNSRKRRWTAVISPEDRARNLGYYLSEIEAALAYDDAARIAYGEFAFLNFPDGIPDERRETLRAEIAAAKARLAAKNREATRTGSVSWWEQREPVLRTCLICGKEFGSKATQGAMYCGKPCYNEARRRKWREKRERAA